MKLVSWNVNGLRACVTKGFSEFFTDHCLLLRDRALHNQRDLSWHHPGPQALVYFSGVLLCF